MQKIIIFHNSTYSWYALPPARNSYHRWLLAFLDSMKNIFWNFLSISPWGIRSNMIKCSFLRQILTTSIVQQQKNHHKPAILRLRMIFPHWIRRQQQHSLQNQSKAFAAFLLAKNLHCFDYLPSSCLLQFNSQDQNSETWIFLSVTQPKLI